MAVTRLHWLSMLALVVSGLVILVLSLIAANRFSVAGARLPSSGFRVYFGRAILPDHLAYSAIMLRDRVVLESADPVEQISLKLEYAERRYQAAMALFENDQQQLSISTLTKSQKYLISAGYQTIVLENQPAMLAQVRQAVDHSMFRLDEYLNVYQGANKEVITQLREETRILLEKLDEQLVASQS